MENEIHALPGVESCAVIGVADEKWGEAVRAVVVRAPDADFDAAALLAHLRERLAGYKVPKSVRFAESLPRTGSGKISKSEVRDRFGD